MKTLEQFGEYSISQTIIRYASFVLALTFSVIYLIHKTELSSHIQLGSDFQIYFSSDFFGYLISGSVFGWSCYLYLVFKIILETSYFLFQAIFKK